MLVFGFLCVTRRTKYAEARFANCTARRTHSVFAIVASDAVPNAERLSAQFLIVAALKQLICGADVTDVFFANSAYGNVL